MYLVVDEGTLYKFYITDRLRDVDVYWTTIDNKRANYIEVPQETPSLTHQQVLDTYPELLL